MQNQLTQPALGAVATSTPANLAPHARELARSVVGAARHAIMALGLLALVAVLVVLLDGGLRERVLSSFSATETPSELDEELPMPPALPSTAAPHAPVDSKKPAAASSEEIQQQKQRVATWIARRYRVASDATHMFVGAAYQTARELKLDPLLILSVIAIESRFNPFAESPAGAQGLMQVMSSVHKDKFEPLGGIEAALNPVANIKVGSRILKEYVKRGGSVEAGLKMYVGAALLETDSGYGAKVLAEYARLKEVAVGRKVSIYATTAAASKPAPKQKPVRTEEVAVSTNEKAPVEGEGSLAGAEQIAGAL